MADDERAGDEGAAVVDREAARVLLLDGRGRVLLFLGRDPARPDDGTWWFTPGGGAEDGEDPGQTARRELWEETGLRVDALEGPVAERTTEFGFDGVTYRQHEHYFVARLGDAEVVTAPAAYTELEERAVLGSRWWGEAELRTTDDVVHPGWLGAWLSAETLGRAG
ncbi:NUDIX hydrolase [Aquipuribacter hungaricus]|uniref:NUDIX hydrolase n=1 Tax=Aquipuribacter hungaricus TaxID=545624 RepID=A0ABV7WJ98_9MICO